jgi:tRNA threonylcarbamoyladenosine biosynthesis protein TsaB
VNLLAIDTSSIACSVALQLGSRVFERHEEKPREHTQILMPMIREVLQEGKTTIAELDAIVLGNGPGSFIGMRIAASVAQGLAYGASLPIAPVSSLGAVAEQVLAETEADTVIVAQDAHMDEVYLGAFGRGEGDRLEPLFAERLHGQEPIGELHAKDARGRVAAGFGWIRYPQLAAANERLFESRCEILHPRARYLLPSGTSALQLGISVDPQDIVPAYLRQKVAEEPGRGAT